MKARCIAMMASTTLLRGGLPACDANAQSLTVDQFQHPKGERDLSYKKTYPEGISDGLIAYNMSVEDKIILPGANAGEGIWISADLVQERRCRLPRPV